MIQSWLQYAPGTTKLWEGLLKSYKKKKKKKRAEPTEKNEGNDNSRASQGKSGRVRGPAHSMKSLSLNSPELPEPSLLPPPTLS